MRSSRTSSRRSRSFPNRKSRVGRLVECRGSRHPVPNEVVIYYIYIDSQKETHSVDGGGLIAQGCRVLD